MLLDGYAEAIPKKEGCGQGIIPKDLLSLILLAKAQNLSRVMTKEENNQVNIGLSLNKGDWQKLKEIKMSNHRVFPLSLK